MFMGEYQPSMDEKGRVAIPVRLRKAFGEDRVVDRLILTYGFDKCIMAFRDEDWKVFVQEKLIPLPQSDQMNRKRIRYILGGAFECDLDRQGRIMIPGYLKEYAAIDEDLIILGVYDRVEIWSKKVYELYRPAGDEIDSFAADLGF
jgi:MraZ protein